MPCPPSRLVVSLDMGERGVLSRCPALSGRAPMQALEVARRRRRARRHPARAGQRGYRRRAGRRHAAGRAGGVPAAAPDRGRRRARLRGPAPAGRVPAPTGCSSPPRFIAAGSPRRTSALCARTATRSPAVRERGHLAEQAALRQGDEQRRRDEVGGRAGVERVSLVPELARQGAEARRAPRRFSAPPAARTSAARRDTSSATATPFLRAMSVSGVSARRVRKAVWTARRTGRRRASSGGSCPRRARRRGGSR